VARAAAIEVVEMDAVARAVAATGAAMKAAVKGAAETEAEHGGPSPPIRRQ